MKIIFQHLSIQKIMPLFMFWISSERKLRLPWTSLVLFYDHFVNMLPLLKWAQLGIGWGGFFSCESFPCSISHYVTLPNILMKLYLALPSCSGEYLGNVDYFYQIVWMVKKLYSVYWTCWGSLLLFEDSSKLCYNVENRTISCHVVVLSYKLM